MARFNDKILYKETIKQLIFLLIAFPLWFYCVTT